MRNRYKKGPCFDVKILSKAIRKQQTLPRLPLSNGSAGELARMVWFCSENPPEPIDWLLGVIGAKGRRVCRVPTKLLIHVFKPALVSAISHPPGEHNFPITPAGLWSNI